MGFDQAWFDELRQLTQPVLAAVAATPIEGYYPHVGELRVAGSVGPRFYGETQQLIHRLVHTRYAMSADFKTTSQAERHIYNFPAGRSFRMQWNIGFYAGDSPDEDHARIGLGFRINMHQNEKGIDDFLYFANLVHGNQASFDQTFRALGPYSEPESIFAGAANLAVAMVQDARGNRVSWADDWRFYGRVLKRTDPLDVSILNSVPNFSTEAIRVFDLIRNSGFGY
jgi:hypothetical protein